MTKIHRPEGPPLPAVMGILNVTPDSFYDGGKYVDTSIAYERSRHMLEEGVDIIDVGGESTGPGSQEVSVEEERLRIFPVIRRVLKEYPNARLSIDTYKADIAREAIAAGAWMVNDVTAGRGDRKMFAVIAAARCPYVLMHSKDDSPRTTLKEVQYDDVMKTIRTFFEKRIALALKTGIRLEQIILDPGLGHFVSSDRSYSWEILERLGELQEFGCPILLSPSRKSFTEGVGHAPPNGRLPETLRATRIALAHGASIIRTHDVRETVVAAQEYRKQSSYFSLHPLPYTTTNVTTTEKQNGCSPRPDHFQSKGKDAYCT